MATDLTSPAVLLGPDDAGCLVTAEAFREGEFVEGFRYERVRGRLVVMSPAGQGHRDTSKPFRRELGGYWRDHPERILNADEEYVTVLLPGLRVSLAEAFR